MVAEGETKGRAAPRCPQRDWKGILLENAARGTCVATVSRNGVKGVGLGSVLLGLQSISCLRISQDLLH